MKVIEQVKTEFLDRMKNDLSPSDYKLYVDSFEKEETHGLSLNLTKLKISTIDETYIENRFKLNIIFSNNNYAYYTYNKNELASIKIYPGKDPLYYAGLYYIQEPSAANALFNIDFDENDIVLDLCASPGGKSCQALYNLKTNKGGYLVANEIDYERAKVLSSNIERMGFDNTIVLCNSPDDLANKFINYFDKIILDVPCSGEGMFRKSEEARLQWSNSLVKACANTQKHIIDAAYKMLKDGGLIIYSTCTFSKEEDADNVSYMLSKYSDLKLVESKTLYPFNSIGEGQFYAIIKKGVEKDDSKSSFPTLKSLKGLNVLRYGVKTEEEVNGRIEPTHAATHVDNVKFDRIVELNDEEIYEYLKGDVIRRDLGFAGWCKITYKGLGLGLAKSANKMLKNHYPKGLRLK